jgi:hypothetical protein
MTEAISLGDVSVAIGMPVGKPIPPQTVSSIFATAYRMGQMGIRCDLLMQICGVVQVARDSVLDEFLKCGADKLFWIDSDIAWTPDDFLRMLALSTKYDVIAVAYPSRAHDGNLFQVNTDGITTHSISEHGLFNVNGTGLGFCIVDREPLQVLAAKAPRVIDGYSQREMAEVFRVDRTAKGYRRTEDIAFFDDLRGAGFTVWCDPSIELGHVGEKEWRGRFADALGGTGGVTR